ncbi:hypothetical protein MPLB_1460060 [Mesorhizobium sp. ORS 3324]|nr:hypothetical protein MPLB_1460060 [Mesorhizobium sp. ORS 3324]
MSPLAPFPQIIMEPIVRAALLEDLGRAGDITNDAIIPADCKATLALDATAEPQPAPWRGHCR